MNDQMHQPQAVHYPPLRTFIVKTIDPHDPRICEDVEVTAHLVFNNTDSGETLIFRRYYNDSPRTEVVAEFQPGYFAHYREKQNVEE